MSKVISVAQAAELVNDGDSLMVGGFGLVGSPLTILQAIYNRPVKNLTVISNNLGEPGKGLGQLLNNGQISKSIGSFFTSNPDAVRLYSEGLLDVELLPQGTLAEAIRLGGAGIPAFYTPTAAETVLATKKEVRNFKNHSYVLEETLTADIAIIKAHLSDEQGNLIYYKTARNFNPIMATAAKTVIAEIDELVPEGALSAEEIVTPHLFVDYLVLGGKHD